MDTKNKNDFLRDIFNSEDLIYTPKEKQFYFDSNKLGSLIKQKYGSLKEGEIGLNEYLNSIIEEDYPNLNEIRKKVLGKRKDLKAIYDPKSNINTGLANLTDGEIFIGNKPNKYVIPSNVDLDNLKIATLGHEIAHVNDDVANALRTLKETDDDRFKRIVDKISKYKGFEKIKEHLENTGKQDIKEGAFSAGHHLIRKDIPNDKGIYELRNIKRLRSGLGLLGPAAAALGIASTLASPNIAEAVIGSIIPGGVSSLNEEENLYDDTGMVEDLANYSSDLELRRKALKELINRRR